jgi:putative transcriptional regulator
MQGAEEMRERAEAVLLAGNRRVFGDGTINYPLAGQVPRGNGPAGPMGVIEVRLQEVIAARGMTLAELSQRVGVTVVNLSILKNDRARAIRFSTLARLCEVLDCQPGDLLTWRPDGSGVADRSAAEAEAAGGGAEAR